MNKISASLAKYLLLFAIVVLVVSNLLIKAPSNTNLLLLLGIFAVAYIFLSIREFMYTLEKSQLPYDRFVYMPLSVVGIKVIKLGAFAIGGVVLVVSGAAVTYLGILLLIILVADLIVFSLRLSKRVYYVSLFANYILFALENETKVFASQIESIEYRYEVFYLQTKDRKTYPIEIARLNKPERTSFTEKFVLWVVCNKLTFTPEAKEKLADIISEAL
jgi:hypothetical protein